MRVRHPIAIIGGGLSGLVAARALSDAGRRAVVLEAGPALGGRLATMRAGGAVLDHGAQFFTVRSDAFAAFVDELARAELAYEWCRGFEVEDGYPRYAVRGGMDRLAAHLGAGLAGAEGVEVRLGTEVAAVSPGAEGWRVRWPGGQLTAAAVLSTAPVPRSLALLDAGGTELDGGVGPGLRALEYHRVLAVLARLDRPSAVPEPGGRQLSDGLFSFVADNQRKGISAKPAVTLHASHGLSAARWEDDPEATLVDLVAEARPWLGDAAVLDAELVPWRYSGPVEPWPERACAAAVAPGPLVLAGDAFGGPKVEGAFLSGLAAAERLLADG
ncbi:MAG: FAD-dependent oxidoreductase [Acidimicrobiia bacterium]|nr:FAD-dependent oxidoreductase [Acidimicrobiia bacterium]